MMNQAKAEKPKFTIKKTTEISGDESVIRKVYGDGGKVSNESSMRYELARGMTSAHMQNGGYMQPLQDGGLAQGPSHSEGGIQVQQEDTGEPVAEIEGGERVFSREHTQMLEQAAMQIAQAMESGDEQTAQQMAMQLGFAVVEMISSQEESQAAQEQEMAAGEAPEARAAEAANQFGQEPDTMETI